MKNFKFKLNFILNLSRKLKVFKKSISFFTNIKKILRFENIKKIFIEAYDQFYLKKYKLRYFIFFLSLIIFYYLIYLSFPGILHNKSDQNYFTKLLRDQYGLEFSLTPDINYTILPKPHFQINDVIIFNNNQNFQKEIAQVKKLKLYLHQTNFFKKQKLKIKSVELFETNFFINKNDLTYLQKFFNKGFLGRPITVKKANLFYQDMEKSTISFLNLKKVNIFFNDKINNDVLNSEGEIFNIPFNVTWKNDPFKLEQITNLRFKKINLDISNITKIYNKKKLHKLQVYLNRSRYLIDYQFSDKNIVFNSNNSFIGNDKLIFSGNIFVDPFNFEISSSLDRLKLKSLFLNGSLLKEILSRDFILNENFNGKINLDIKKLENNPFFNRLKVNANFKGRNLEFNNSVFLNDKIANLIIKKGTLFEEKNDLIFKSTVEFVINDLDKFYNKLVVPKKNRNNFKSLKLEILINLTNDEFKILSIKNERFENKEFQEIDELIYEFNSGGIKVSNWIEFKNFANKIISSYSG